MEKVPTRNEWIFDSLKNITDNKEVMQKHLIFTMLNKTIQMFEYEGLPDTINHKDLETILQVNGYAIVNKVDDKLYAFCGGLGGTPNPYYLPTLAIVANPALKYNKSLKIDEDCVVGLNDYYYQGMMPLFSKYSSMTVEAELSLKNALLLARVPALASAGDDKTYKSAEKFFKEIADGKAFGVIASTEFLEGLKTHSFIGDTKIRDIIEAIQYIKGSWYNEIGLNATFNMKREAINEAEADMNNDMLFPTIDAMLGCRQQMVEKINAKYGTNITVKLSSTWARNDTKDKLQVEMLENEVENLEQVSNTDTEEREVEIEENEAE